MKTPGTQVANRASLAKMSVSDVEHKRYDPVADDEIRLAVAQSIYRHKCRIEVLSVGRLMQANE